MNRAFSKILILVILVALAGGGIFVWQHGWIGKTTTQPTPESKTTNSAKNIVADASIMSNMGHLRTTAELIYMQDESYNRVNCSNTGTSCGANCWKGNISLICDDISKASGEKPVIHASDNAYCAYVPLSNNNYYCVDSMGNAEKINARPDGCNNTSFVCP